MCGVDGSVTARFEDRYFRKQQQFLKMTVRFFENENNWLRLAILSIDSDLRLTPWSKLTSFSKITIGDFPQYLTVVYKNYFHTSSYFRQSHLFKRFLTTTMGPHCDF